MSWRGIALGLAVVAGALLPTDAWAQRSMRCGSRNYRYSFCSSGEPIRFARLERQRSDSPCIQGRSWGWQRSGIWVDNGCEGDFFLDTFENRPPPPPPNYGGGWGGGYGEGRGGYGGGGGYAEPAPYWAVGQWQTYGPVNGFYRSLSVYPTGSISYTGGGGTRNGYWRRDEVWLSDGIRLTVTRRSRVELEVYHPNHGRLIMRRID